MRAFQVGQRVRHIVTDETATVVVREAFIANGYRLHDLAYASRRVQQTQHVGMAVLNNAAKSGRLMLTDIAEIMTFRKWRGR